MKKEKITEYFVVLNEGQVIFKSVDEEVANSVADELLFQSRRNAMNELGMDEDSTEEELALADYQAGYDDGIFEVEQVDISNFDDDDEVELNNGDCILVSDIIDAPSQIEKVLPYC